MRVHYHVTEDALRVTLHSVYDLVVSLPDDPPNAGRQTVHSRHRYAQTIHDSDQAFYRAVQNLKTIGLA
jgi:hypothetical protein